MKKSNLSVLLLLLVPLLHVGRLRAFTAASRVSRHIEVSPPAGDVTSIIKPNASRSRRSPTRHNPSRRQLRRFLSANSNAEIGSSSQAIKATATLAGLCTRFREFANKNFFLVGMIVAVTCARLFPGLGKTGGILHPELFIGRFGVTAIFLLSGLSMERNKLAKAASNWKFNFLVQLVNFGVWPLLIGLPLTGMFGSFFPNAFPPAILDGILMLSCLPTTVNMSIILTSACGGNVALSLFNGVVSNLAAIFVTPAILFRLFGETISLPFMSMVSKLSTKVLVPVMIGQGLRYTKAKDWYKENAKIMKRLQELILLSILWNTFSTTFATPNFGLELRHGLGLAALMPTLHVAALVGMFRLFSLFPGRRRLPAGDVVAAMYCTSHKGLAFGLPLLNTIFEGNANIAAYCAPILFYHPAELILGSLLVPRMEKYIQEEETS